MADVIPTRQPVQVSIKIKKMQLEQRVLRKPQSAADAFGEKVGRLAAAKEDVDEHVIRKEEKKKVRVQNTKKMAVKTKSRKFII